MTKTYLLHSNLLGLAVAATFLAAPGIALSQDADGDGVPNGADFFPCDASAAAVAFAPASGQFGTLMFEDMWPYEGDLDFNDVVLTYNYSYRLTGAGLVAGLTVTLVPRALGGTTNVGLGLHLPVAGASATTITRRVGSAAATTLTRTIDSQLTVAVTSNMRELFTAGSGPINSLPDQARLTGQAVVVEITFAQPVSMAVSGAPYDLYIFRTSDPSHEIHRPEYGGTSGMASSLFGTGDDGSANGRYFVDGRGVPFALHIPALGEYPSEYEQITSLFPNLLTFASSGGTTNQDFYVSNVQTAFRFRDSGGQPAPSPTAPASIVPDTSCMVSVAQTCLAHRNAGQTTSGIYSLDPDGSGPGAPFDAYCDMTSFGGGWTECSSIVNTSAEDISCSANSNWFDNCVNYTMASWTGSQVMISLTNQSGQQVYSSWGTRPTSWTTSNLTSINGTSSQYNRASQHSNPVTLSDGTTLTISGYDSGNQGWGGSWGNGYVIATQTTPLYGGNNVVTVMSLRNSSPSYSNCGARSFGGLTASHEVMYGPGGTVSTNGNATLLSSVAFLGQFRFLVR